MKSLFAVLSVGVLLSQLLACGHAQMRGSVVMKISDTEAHVCMGRGEVAAGDPVALIRHRCRQDINNFSGYMTTTTGPCQRIVVASGQVVRVLNEHYSVVRFPPGTPFQEGQTIEKGTGR